MNNLFLMAMIVGVFLAFFVQFNGAMILTKNFHFVSVAFLALAVGYRIDDWLMSITLNKIPMFIVMYLIAYMTTVKIKFSN